MAEVKRATFEKQTEQRKETSRVSLLPLTAEEEATAVCPGCGGLASSREINVWGCCFDCWFDTCLLNL